jgi:4-carboxymuconolactone decarboxylase
MNKAVIHYFAVAALSLVAAVFSPSRAYPQTPAAAPAKPAPQASPQQTTAQRLFGDINPKFAELTDNVLFGDIWARPGLSPRDRSLVTVSALIAMNRPDQLRSHLARARENGLTETELVETITHLAFYAGWPSAVTASVVAKDVFQKK